MNTDNKELEALLSNFRPAFGNDKHLQIADTIANIGKERKKLKEKKSYERLAKGQSAVEKRIASMEKQLIYLLKQETQKTA